MSTALVEKVALADLARALACRTRVRILELLGERVRCVNALACRLGVTQAAVSQHLQVLRSAGLVESERRGLFVHYRLRPQPLAALAEQLVDLARGDGCRAGWPTESTQSHQTPEEAAMCAPERCCKAASEPKECTPEQIQECHGDAAEHPCETEGCERGNDTGCCSEEQAAECQGGACGEA